MRPLGSNKVESQRRGNKRHQETTSREGRLSNHWSAMKLGSPKRWPSKILKALMEIQTTFVRKPNGGRNQNLQDWVDGIVWIGASIGCDGGNMKSVDKGKDP